MTTYVQACRGLACHAQARQLQMKNADSGCGHGRPCPYEIRRVRETVVFLIVRFIPRGAHVAFADAFDDLHIAHACRQYEINGAVARFLIE